LSSGQVSIAVANSLSDHSLVKSSLTFAIIQNPWRIGRSVNNKNCSKLDFLTPQIFPDFSS
jgi:hypothetical protein